MIKLLDLIIIIEQCTNDLNKRKQKIFLINFFQFLFLYLYIFQIFLKKSIEIKYGIFFDSHLLTTLCDVLTAVPVVILFIVLHKSKKALKIDNVIEDRLIESFLEEYQELEKERKEFNFPKLIQPARTRWCSVKAAIEALAKVQQFIVPIINDPNFLKDNGEKQKKIRDFVLDPDFHGKCQKLVSI